MKALIRQSLLLALFSLLASHLAAAPLGTAFTYQGKLNSGGNPADGSYDLRFTIYDAVENGAQIGSAITNGAVTVSNGLFTTTLEFGVGVFAGEARWLAIAVRSNGAPVAFTLLSPRQPLTPAPYALYAPNAGTADTAQSTAAGVVSNLSLATGAVTSDKIRDGTVSEADLSPALAQSTFWRLDGNAGTTAETQFLGTTDGRPLELKVNAQRALRLEPGAESPNLIGGYLSNTVAIGIEGAVIGGGGNAIEPNVVMSRLATISGGVGNVISTNAGDATIGGGWLNLIGPVSEYALLPGCNYATIGGGSHNTARAVSATVAGGYGNEALAQDTAIGGGYLNYVASLRGTIAGGYLNRVEPGYEGSFIGGGYGNRVAAANSSVVGGYENTITNLVDGFIGGGLRNYISAFHTVIGGGLFNTNAGPGATIGGGNNNSVGAAANDAFLGGGVLNRVEGYRSVIAGGESNSVQSVRSLVVGGLGNTIQINADHSTIGGGRQNTIEPLASNSTIGGGKSNTIQTDADYSTIGGGSDNTIQTDTDCSTIGGGLDNTIWTWAIDSTIGGGWGNTIQTATDCSTIGGGKDNTILTNADYSTIGGGRGNTIQTSASNSTIAGGADNTNNATYSTIGGGSLNTIQTNASRGAIGGGHRNTIQTGATYSTIAGGRDHTIHTDADYATIPGGYLNAATNYAFAAGNRAKANHRGAFVWGDSTSADIASTNANSVTMRASGGYRLFSNSGATAGAYLSAGSGTWTSMSDRNAKENLAAVNARAVLEKVASLPLATWTYKSQDPSIRHMGPMAQDFKAAFGLGESDTGITTIDADGVALAAIQGLNEKVEVRSPKTAFGSWQRRTRRWRRKWRN